MNKPLTINETDEQKVYFISDTHLNHNREFIYGKRGFDNSKSHTDFVIAEINKIVRPNDILFHLGDFCLNTDESGFNELLSRIYCQNIYLIWGNHNGTVWQVYQREAQNWAFRNVDGVLEEIEVYPLKYRSMTFLGNYVELSVNGNRFVLSHFPINIWNKGRKGAIMLHGHCHGNLKSSLPYEIDCGKVLDVSFDVFRKPLSVFEVLNIVNRKKILTIDNHIIVEDLEGQDE